MPLHNRLALRAAAALGFAVGATAAQAQANRPWVDPPASAASPAEKVEPPQPAASAPAAGEAAAKKPAETSPAPKAATASRPAMKRLAAKPRSPETAQKRVVDKRQVEVTRTGAIRPPTAAARRERIIREGRAEGLELMTLRTIEFPDGRRVQVLTRPDPGTVQELLGR